MICKIYLLSSLRLPSSDWHHRQGLWLTHVRYQTQQVYSVLLASQPAPLPWPRSYSLRVLERSLYLGKSSLHSLYKGRCPFLLLSNSISLSSFFPPSSRSPSFLFFVFFPSPDFLTFVTKRHPVTTCLMMRCRYDDTVGSFIVVCDISHLGMAQART